MNELTSPGMTFLAVVVAVAVLYLAVLLVADRVKKHRRGVGLSIMDDRPGDDSQFAEWRAQMREDHEGEP
jgi:hypothetical protein